MLTFLKNGFFSNYLNRFKILNLLPSRAAALGPLAAAPDRLKCLSNFSRRISGDGTAPGGYPAPHATLNNSANEINSKSK